MSTAVSLIVIGYKISIFDKLRLMRRREEDIEVFFKGLSESQLKDAKLKVMEELQKARLNRQIENRSGRSVFGNGSGSGRNKSSGRRRMSGLQRSNKRKDGKKDLERSIREHRSPVSNNRG